MKRFFSGIFIALLLSGLGVWSYAKFHVVPCSEPVKYSLGRFDGQFGINQEQFLADIEAASNIWATAASGQSLFVYDPAGSLKINLVYDSRQETTNRLRSLGISIEDTKDSYDKLKLRYQTSKSDYELAKQAYENELAKYQQDQNDYNQQVNYWNSRGGAPKETYDSLASQKKQLDQRRAQLTADQAELNQLVANLNAIIDALNQLGKKLNLNIADYNNVGASQGSEFEEGLYVESSTGKYIDIYEFDNQTQLVRLLAHELGHSLGLLHVDDSEAIMYRLNSSTNQIATGADIAELKAICKLP
ncbi:MAG: hypothetical protein A3J07_01645 [Candidatus Doudnabacteria bacterium RIFCSPLOWO2_02_FULL_49_13]|uniref:Peptidase M10 metallopeptidase domain-containing protein n=1 Tax=Candidatus Doudnabacteria bacterium RIFCSPHIGHO2_12_FULL_48_16 TaxID=1817838 RepID=A0A1F5PL57_9BACT|nr:MAG: hypothetical protein A3B77_01070 [Candidatus Doudnabacteria bacterium RIFCSPHIGHO2_02_FULL_49_24]OGE88834.1 MAG: hypothetical protein A2760_01425 [Candidatus Doudnabacteria bacterium RIFCSPHIGHO2_01_FULL_50_67]OGE90646.1 MAG: hypothetical protein A3E29_00740 [Candidatus Doudnabacteria bacterium RIFCSPHIGHO2_12_FULL_48_16]OGE96977.1 MAG: hypothetical protein A2990_02770 [Candidatus Doudnabacteria bacterium RIFCSPLOWO2_01_FULL_49_40]OGF02478.1 MAG: hypothetical protein A3H14_03280 [Candid